jgi:hypothetical protein
MRLIEKNEDATIITPKRITGISKGVLLNTTFLSLIVRVLKNRRVARAATPIKSCLGSIKASVVSVEKSNGKTRRVTPRRKRETFSK